MSSLKKYKVDLHIHTVLSPCGAIDMSPLRIVQEAKKRGLQIIGIADHNSTRQAAIVKQVGDKLGVKVLMGVEITSKEEVHLLAFFETIEVLEHFQGFLDANMVAVENKPDKFGYQVWVNEQEEILGEEPYLLITGLKVGVDLIIKKVRELNGIIIPAHIDKSRFSWLSQLGFFDSDTDVDALEVSRYVNMEVLFNKHPKLKQMTFISSSDAHLPNQIGEIFTEMLLKDASFSEIKMALNGEDGRKVMQIVKCI